MRDAQGEPVVGAHRFAGDDLDRQVELQDHSAHDLQLLAVLFPEYRDIGLDEIEQLQDDRAHAVEETGSECAVELVGDQRRLHTVGLGRRIHVVLVRREQDVDALALETCAVRVEAPRVAVEILVRTELQPIDEDARDDAVAVTARDAHQRQVALVEIAHRRHECDAAGAGEPLAQRIGRLDHFHRGSPCGARWSGYTEPRLKNSRWPRMPATRASRRSTWAESSTKFRRSLFTIRSGASS